MLSSWQPKRDREKSAHNNRYDISIHKQQWRLPCFIMAVWCLFTHSFVPLWQLIVSMANTNNSFFTLCFGQSSIDVNSSTEIESIRCILSSALIWYRYVTHACVILCVKTCKVKVLKCNFVCFSFVAIIRSEWRFFRRKKNTNYLIASSVLYVFYLQPGESGFVLLGDLTVETSTDPEPNDTWICDPPSPCDVQFKNANVVINGKSSLRDKSKNDQKVSFFVSSVHCFTETTE